jgi:hypothetical protein
VQSKYCIFSSKNETCRKLVQKGSKNGTLQEREFCTWGPPGSQIDPRLIPGGRNRSIRPFWTPKWPQNDVKMEPFEWEIITRCHVISVYGGTAKAGHKWSAKKMARVPPMQITFFRSKTAAQYPASQRGVSKNWREFRLCKRLFFGVHRLHSTQQMRKLSKEMASIPSIQMTVLHNASATQYTASEKAAWKRITRVPSM